jgi:hypothetical protein
MEAVITLEMSASEHEMLLAALDKKIWSLVQTGLSGAYRQVPAYKKLRAEIADVRNAGTSSSGGVFTI